MRSSIPVIITAFKPITSDNMSPVSPPTTPPPREPDRGRNSAAVLGELWHRCFVPTGRTLGKNNNKIFNEIKAFQQQNFNALIQSKHSRGRRMNEYFKIQKDG
ncbi:hypothetical protein WA026_019495 [Henosepilachna vigintioctopunctata]|uniref:Uncharacterized protein n=1 Tax=Henosepilachna vigintioctopunctata TaxID=420089 RepID=A0AAW1U028_9CUCU